MGRYAAFLSLWLWLPCALTAQGVPLGGTVVDRESGDAVVDASVRVFRGLGQQEAETRTGPDGSFRLSIPEGRYSVLVEGRGYEARRFDGIQAPQKDATWTVSLTPTRALLDPLVTSPDRSRVERSSAGSVSVSVVGRGEGADSGWGAWTQADLVEGLPGVATARLGLAGRALGNRGLHSPFSGGPLLLEDGRVAQMPSSRMNGFEFISSTLLDVERVELLRGPLSALYGPNATGGALRIVTSSPIDDPGTSVSLSAGQREVFHGAVRQALRLGERTGFRVSGRYFRGLEWEGPDLEGVAPPSPSTETGSAQMRFDHRPWEDGEVVFTAGVSRLLSSVLLLREGPVQATDWTQTFGQARMRKGRLSAMGFLNRGDAGSSVSLGLGTPFVDRSSVRGGQAQYGRTVHPRLDLVGGVDAIHTSPATAGTVHGSWEGDDEFTEIGAYLYATGKPVERVELVGSLRLDSHSRFEGARFSPHVAARFDVAATHNVRAAFNRGYTNPTPDLLFADWITARIPLLDTLGFDVRVVGLPDQGLTFDHRCPGGLQDRCMFSPLLPGIRMPATGAALWDAVLVPLALKSESLRSTLAGMGITPNGFAQIIGRPGPADLTSRLVRWSGGDSSDLFEPASVPGPVARLRPATTENVELGFRGTAGGRFAYSLDLHATRVSDLVGPLEVATPTLYLDGSSVDAFLRRRMTAVGIPAGVADRIAETIAGTAASVPLGTLAPDQRERSDVVLAYRNLGEVRFWGADMGVRWRLTGRLSVLGSFTYLSRDCFDLDADGACGTAGDVTLNAPTLGGSGTLRWRDPALGFTLDGRVRHAGGFPIVASAYRGEVAAHTLLDVSGRVTLPWAPGAAIAVTVTNLLDATHRDFVGAPMIGRLALMTLQYAF